MGKNLFRGKRIHGRKDWVEGCLLNLDEDSGCVYIVPFFNRASTMTVTQIVGLTAIPVDPKTVGQYTGKTDTNGKEVFEGDVVKFCGCAPDWEDEKDLDIRIGFIKFKDGCFMHSTAFSCDGYNELSCLIGEITDSSGRYDEHAVFEVIGNIYDNPELLEVDNA